MPELPPLLPRIPHGGPTSAAFTGLDFSVNADPYGPNPALVQALREADHAHYPDPTYRAVRERLADWHGVSPSEVALAVGASDLLHRIVRAFLPTGGTLLSVRAPFGELARAAALNRAEVSVTTPETILNKIQPGVSLVYIGHPHNPTGHRHSEQQLQALAAACQSADALLIVDEAYAPFLPTSSVPRTASVIRLLSPGKAHGLVGARPAYALGAPEVVARLDNLAPAWHVPAGTAVVLAALPEAGDFLEQTLPRVRQEAEALATALRFLGPVERHGTPYMVLEVGNAAAVAAGLLNLRIRVRDCASYGLPDRIRISTRRPQENVRLIQALKAVLEDVYG
ncbi:histidinol-phosphate transaminase [Deinococcus sp. AJ005]|uniref:pyridoxal phosphate-dependent aminotransferase n=1 Tax=Deinococcus sp. AJ005 TaxID=2652443 RepID=UPI00125CC25C|nr:histidinol-phosphate transaminase [Deinococcus sp. AJ005]QFP76995.1 histidinol-phosphate aminotransferase family protein [Deinococcus sp. AJ005]